MEKIDTTTIRAAWTAAKDATVQVWTERKTQLKDAKVWSSLSELTKDNKLLTTSALLSDTPWDSESMADLDAQSAEGRRRFGSTPSPRGYPSPVAIDPITSNAEE